MVTAKPPTLFGKRVIVRHVRESDAADRRAAGHDPELTRLYGGDPREERPFTQQDARAWYERLAREPLTWVIEHERRCVGTVRLHSVEWSSRAARLAIGIFDTSQWGRGLGTEAIQLVLHCAFGGFGLHRVGLRVLDVNERAIRSYEKCGFVREGLERESVPQAGEWHGDVIMGCLDREFWAATRAEAPDVRPDLQKLFDEPILERGRVVPEDWDGATHLAAVRTASEDVIVRSSGVYGWVGWDGALPGAAQWGCNRLFGVDTRRVFDLEPAHDLLRAAGGVPVPRLLRLGLVDGWPCAVVERMPGRPLGSFAELSDAALVEFGAALARQHQRRTDYFGTPRGTYSLPLAAFHAEAAAMLRAVAERCYADDPEAQRELEPACQAMLALPTPEDSSPIILDHGADQYLVDGGRISALVDLELLALAPRALDLIALELELDERTAAAVRTGYLSVAPLPDLRVVRFPYLYLMALLMHHEEETFGHWLSRPALLDA